MTPELRAAKVKMRALELGFEDAGITDLTPPPHAEALNAWLAQRMAGSMEYMSRQAARREDPATILPGATRAVMLTRNYYQPDRDRPHGGGRVAKYARGRDYHDALSDPLSELADYLRSLGTSDTVAEWYVDAGPVPERELAQRAGIGWIGKNTMLINPERGSFFFIASVLTNLDLAVDSPFEADRCGTCRKCLDACPTDAFPTARVLDSRRCISYLTIEHRDEIDHELQPLLADWVFGCDVCQDVCPWNQKFAQPKDDPVLGFMPSLAEVDLAELMAIDGYEFDRKFGWTPLERPGVEGMRRNARIAAQNMQQCPTRQTP